MAAKQKGVGVGLGAALGVAAAAAAAAGGAYWLYGSKNAAQHRKQVRGWMFKARGEVLDAVEKLQNIDKETYVGIVDSVMKRYRGAKGVTTAELAALARELKSSWDHMQRASSKGKKVIKKAKKSARKAKK